MLLFFVLIHTCVLNIRIQIWDIPVKILLLYPSLEETKAFFFLWQSRWILEIIWMWWNNKFFIIEGVSLIEPDTKVCHWAAEPWPSGRRRRFASLLLIYNLNFNPKRNVITLLWLESLVCSTLSSWRWTTASFLNPERFKHVMSAHSLLHQMLFQNGQWMKGSSAGSEGTILECFYWWFLSETVVKGVSNWAGFQKFPLVCIC